jgi:nitrogen-specific signal transduction histidine kinase
MARSDQSQQVVAIVEAEVGSLLELLPVPLLVTSESGQILRANTAARLFLDSSETLTGKRVDNILHQQAISARVTTLSHGGYVVRLYALQHPSAIGQLM